MKQKSTCRTFCHFCFKHQYAHIKYVERKRVRENSAIKDYLTTVDDGKKIQRYKKEEIKFTTLHLMSFDYGCFVKNT